MDTGGLGLLQLLIQSGIPPQALMALLQHQQTLGQPEINSGGGGPGGPGPAGSTTSGEGTPGVGPTDGTTTGTGNMNLSQTIDAAISGIPGGAIGQMSGSTPAGIGAKAAMTVGSLLGGHLGPLGLANTLLGPVVGVARGAQNSVGGPVGQTFGQAAAEMAQALKDMTVRSFFGLAPPAPPEFTVPNTVEPDLIGNVPTGTPATAPVGLPEGIANAISSAVAAAGSSEADGPSGGPGGNAGAPSGGGDSGNPGDY